MKEVKIEFTDKEITPWGGMVFLKNMLNQSGLRKFLQGCPELPKPGSNRGYMPETIIESFLVSVWCGANRFLHTEILRHDTPLGRVFGWERTPGQDVYKRYFGKFTQKSNDAVFHTLFKWYFQKLLFDNYTIDFDSTVLTRYGEQEGALRGYNPSKRGRLSHHPLMAFIADCNMVANLWLRSGNTSASGNFSGFLEETLERLKGKKIGLVRLDSGFYDKKVFSLLEEKSFEYIISAPLHLPLQRKLAEETNWLTLEEGVSVTSSEYKAAGWTSARRVIMIRQTIEVRPKATGKQLRLFKNSEIYSRYRFSCLITSLTLPPAEVWRLYRHRAEAENKIKELKYDFGYDSFNMRNFYGTEAALSFVMLAYNFMSLFRQFVMNADIQRRLATLRYTTFGIGAYLVREGSQIILKMAVPLKRREWYTGLWEKSRTIEFPVQYSNA